MQNVNFPVFLNVFDSVYSDFTVLVNFAKSHWQNNDTRE